jgi:type 1 glutamine amidotransferase
MKKLLALALAALAAGSLHAEPKKLLVVTTTTGFRHASIPTLEKVLTQLGKESGEFTVDFVQQPPGHPATGFPKKPKADATPEEKTAYEAAEAKWNAALKLELTKLSPENLQNYDGIVFASTTGNLPVPDPQGLLDWIKAGHAFIGIHAASDTFHDWPGFIDMLGGEFDRHGPQVSVECLNQKPQHPANAHLGKTWTISQEEIYEFKNYDSKKVEDLLIMDKHPQNHSAGHFPMTWCKDYGAGKVFYTSLGHREDIIDTDPNLKDRKNDVAISKAYQQHVLGGIEWALGLKSRTPQ